MTEQCFIMQNAHGFSHVFEPPAVLLVFVRLPKGLMGPVTCSCLCTEVVSGL